MEYFLLKYNYVHLSFGKRSLGNVSSQRLFKPNLMPQNLMKNFVRKHHESTIRNNYYSILNMKGKEYHTSSANLFYFSICLFLHDTKEVRSISEYVGRK